MNISDKSQDISADTTQHLPGKAALAVICFLSAAFLAASVMSFAHHVYIISMPVIALSSSFYGIALYYIRHAAIITLPLTVSAISIVAGAPVALTTVVVSASVVLSICITLCTIRKTPLFALLTGLSVIFICLVSAVIYMELSSEYGSLREGISSITESIRSLIPQSLADMDLEPSDEAAAVSLLNNFLPRASLLIPSGIASVAIITAYLTFGALALISLMFEIFPTFFARTFKTPGFLGLTYIMLSLISLFTNESSGALYYVVFNLNFSLMILFAGEGIRRFIVIFKGLQYRGKVCAVAALVFAVIFAYGTLIPLAAFIGACAAVLGNKRRADR